MRLFREPARDSSSAQGRKPTQRTVGVRRADACVTRLRVDFGLNWPRVPVLTESVHSGLRLCCLGRSVTAGGGGRQEVAHTSGFGAAMAPWRFYG